MVADTPWKTVTASEVHLAAGDAEGAAALKTTGESRKPAAPAKRPDTSPIFRVQAPAVRKGPFLAATPVKAEAEAAPWCDAFGLSPWTGE